MSGDLISGIADKGDPEVDPYSFRKAPRAVAHKHLLMGDVFLKKKIRKSYMLLG
jgi:hypothetical protein